MNKTVINYVKSALRRTWGRSKQRQSCLRAAKVAYGQYKCEKCNGIFRRKNIEVDHIIAIGRFNDFNNYIEKLFCATSGLRVLCVGCHKIKTSSDRKKMK